MRKSSNLGGVVAAFSVACLIMLSGALPAQAEVTYSGRALGVVFDTPVTSPVIVGDTGELPPNGGSLSDNVVSAFASANGQTASATSVNCATSGISMVAQSSSEIQGLVVDLSQGLLTATLTASVVSVQSLATCTDLNAQTTISGLAVGGVAVAVTGQANQSVQIPGIATLVINEQVFGAGEVTVNAMHLTLLDGTECIIAEAYSDLHNCTPLPVDESTWGHIKALYR